MRSSVYFPKAMYLLPAIVLLTSCLSSKYIPPADHYALIRGFEHIRQGEELLLTKGVISRDSKFIDIYKIDSQFVSMLKPVYELRIAPGKHMIYAHCKLGQKHWQVEKYDSLTVEVNEGETWYLDCSPASLFLSEEPPVEDFSWQKEKDYIKFYDGERRDPSEVARLKFNEHVHVWVDKKEFTMNGKKYEGIEFLPGDYSLKLGYIMMDGYISQDFINSEWKAVAGHIYTIREKEPIYVGNVRVKNWEMEILDNPE
ncbi:MAG: hypothetical protein ACOYXB_12935 [Bacteroidota bacterium]